MHERGGYGYSLHVCIVKNCCKEQHITSLKAANALQIYMYMYSTQLSLSTPHIVNQHWISYILMERMCEILSYLAGVSKQHHYITFVFPSLDVRAEFDTSTRD